QIVEPAHAFLLLDWHACRVDLALERGGPLEFGARPELGRCQPERQTIRRDRQACVHQEPADCVLLVAAFLELASGRHLREPDLLRRGALEGKFRGVLRIRMGPSVAWIRRADAAKWPSRILSSLTFPLEKNR